MDGLRHLRPCLALPLVLAGAARQGGTEQLVAHVGQVGAAVNGASVKFHNAPLQIEGRTMVPLAETLAFLGLAITHGLTDDTINGLSLARGVDQATLNGQPLPFEGNFLRRGDDLYIRAGLLADVVGGRLSGGPQGEFYFTIVRPADGNPSLPQPRFTTDRVVYDIGQPVKVEEFSFEPQGGNVYLHWTNLQPAYFKPGPQTITLEADNREGQGNRVSRTIMVTDRVMNTPLQFALKYDAIGELFTDHSLAYPSLPREQPESGGPLLLVSDSPEVADRTGALFQDTLQTPFRLVAYHVNGASPPGRLAIAVKNVDQEPATVRVVRMGDTAPERIEGVLGQVTLLAFLTDPTGARYHVEPGESALIYLSPALAEHTGASVLADVSSDRRIKLTVAMNVGDPLTPDAISALDLLTPDGRHVRGEFPASARQFSLDLRNPLPAKAVIGDPVEDPPEVGRDVATQARETLDGNYGVTYEITVHHARGVVGAVAPRGGLYKGVVTVIDPATGARDLVRLPREGVLANPDRPMIFLRSNADNLRLEFIPASGSQLPVHLIFYRP